MPSLPIIIIAILYGIGAHGIMTLNDFKALEGDQKMNLKSLPVVLGPAKAARLACIIMSFPQIVIVGLLSYRQQFPFAIGLSVIIVLQFFAMSIMLRDPEKKAPWYNATGVLLYVFGMMLTAFALRDIVWS